MCFPEREPSSNLKSLKRQYGPQKFFYDKESLKADIFGFPGALPLAILISPRWG